MADQAEKLRELIKGQATNSTPSVHRVMAITSGKGGVGKTNLSVNLGIALMKLGSRVLLFDADWGMANVDMILGIIPKYNLGHVINGQKNIEDIITIGPMGMKVIANGSGDYQMANLSERSLEFLQKQLDEIEKDIDIMLIDTGAGISRHVLKFVLAAEEVIIVTTPEPTAIADAYGIIKVVTSYNSDIPIHMVINMVKDEFESKMVMERLSLVAKRFLDIELTNIGYVVADPNVSKAVKQQQPFLISQPRTLAAQNIMEIADNLLNRSTVSSRPGSFFQRLIKGKIR